MDIADHVHGDLHGDLQRTVHLPIPSSSLANYSSTGASIPVSQGKPPQNGHSSKLSTSGISQVILSQETHAFPRPPLISRDDSRANPFTFHPSTFEVGRASQPLPQRSSYDPLLSHVTPPFTSGVLDGPSLPTTYGPELQMTLGYPERPASLLRQISVPPFPFGPFHTHHNYFLGQHAMPLFQYQPSQLHPSHGYPSPGPNSYPPHRYYPAPLHPPLPYHGNEPSVQSSYPFHQPTQPLPTLMPQLTTVTPRPSQPSSSAGFQTYAHYVLPQQHQLDMNQWYHDLRSASNMSALRVEHRPPIHLHPQPLYLRRDSGKVKAQSTDSERLSSTDPGPGIVTVSPVTAELREQVSTLNFSGSSIRDQGHRPATDAPPVHNRPPVRRHYHPNPPHYQSEWVMWVGNVLSDATHDEFWRFLNPSAPISPRSEKSSGVEDSGIVSLFLISRSNCAFVNYRSEEQLNNAINQFNGRQLRPDDPRCLRLVCRPRQKGDDLRAGVGAQRGMGVHTQHIKNLSRQDYESGDHATTLSKDRRPSVTRNVQQPLLPISGDEEPSKSTPLGGQSPKVSSHSSSSYASTTSSFLIHHFPKRYFILKSLTQYDLDLSVERGIWATQKHNESILDQAFRTSKEVILIFSVNKSGGFYGYARMVSPILRSNRIVSWAPRTDPLPRTSPLASSELFPDDILEQPTSSSLQCLETNAFPSQAPVLAPSSDERLVDPPASSSSQAESARGRRLAPPSFTRSFEGPCSPQSTLRPAFSPTGPLSAPLPRSGKHFEAGLSGRGKGGGIGDASNQGSQSQPVVEKVHQGRGDINDPPPAALAESLPGCSRKDESWGETFRIEWLETERLPFHRTRHLRNPWNHGRQIKVARDGTEIEPSVGQQLIESWSDLAGATDRHRSQSGAMAGPSGETKRTQKRS